MKKTLFLAAAMLLGAAQAINVTVRDTSGRSVTVPQNPQRVVLGEGRLLYSTAILDREDPFKRVYGWAGDLIKNGPDAYAKYKAKFPDSSAKVRDLGASTANFSVEQLIADKVDLVILTESGHATAKEGGLLDRLDKAKIPYLDFVRFQALLGKFPEAPDTMVGCSKPTHGSVRLSLLPLCCSTKVLGVRCNFLLLEPS